MGAQISIRRNLGEVREEHSAEGSRNGNRVRQLAVLTERKGQVSVANRHQHASLSRWAGKGAGGLLQGKGEAGLTVARSRLRPSCRRYHSTYVLLVGGIREFTTASPTGVRGLRVRGGSYLKRRAAKARDLSADGQVAVRSRSRHPRRISATRHEVPGLRQHRYSRKGRHQQRQYGNNADFPH